HSLRLGLDALSTTPAVPAMIFLADQPTVRLEVIRRIADAGRGDMDAVRPRYGDRPDVLGHPVLLSRAVWRSVSQLEGDAGFTALLSPPAAKMIDIPGDNPDIDTLEDLQLLERTSG
ncbi:MAG TPA: NTP transferase domain-containing protein, partial [Gemmatimonadales bacterium]|nr:NTP transferase domain-containing protein [Gemmatimonadales bacterium]